MPLPSSHPRAFRFTAIETLEHRRLFATFNVTDFGATPNDGKDDTAAIRAAISKSARGDTVWFDAGTYDISSPITLRGGRTYAGDGDAVLKRPGQFRDAHVFETDDNDAKDVTLEGLVFENNGVHINKQNNGEWASGIEILDCTFRNMTGHYPDNHILFISDGLRDSRIAGNTFTNIRGDNAILAFNVSGLVIENNRFDDVYEGIHIINFNNWATGVRVANNVFTQVSRMGIEIQEDPVHDSGGFDGLIVEGNHYSNPKNVQRETFAYSIVPDAAVNTIVRNNYASGPASYPGLIYGIEAAGVNMRIENNRIDGSWVGVVLQHTRNPTVSGNQVWGSKHWLEKNARSSGANILTNDISNDIKAAAPSEPIVSEFATAAVTYLSQLQITDWTNNVGPVELNRSNGGKKTNDGDFITLNGRSYKYGIGVSGDSSLTYNLDGTYGHLVGSIGVDDDSNGGSVDFQVWGDGNLLFDPGIINAGDHAQGMNIDVAGVKELKLVTHDMDGKISAVANASWANVHLT